MEQVVKHYGNAILAIIVLLMLGMIIVAALNTNDGYAAVAFKNALAEFFTKMNSMSGIPTTP